MPRSTLAARNCAAVIIDLPRDPESLSNITPASLNDVKVSISDILDIYSKGFFRAA